MQRTTILVFVGLTAALAAFVSYDGLSERLARLEQTPRVDPADLSSLRVEIGSNERRVARALAELERLRSTPERTQELDRRIAELDRELHEASSALHEQDEKLASFEKEREEIGPRALDERMRAYSASVEEHVRRVGAVAEEALAVAGNTRTDVDRVEKDLARDTTRMWKELLGPTVQLMGEETVGSGVLLASEPTGKPDEWRTRLLTAWHVIRDIQAGPENVHTPVPVTIYGPDKSVTPETARLLEYDATVDLALLELNTTRKLDCGARLAPRSRLERIEIFDRVYAVGCPLGNDPIPTFGEIADTHHSVDGQTYWMISAPTYIGNSGGGIFDAQTHELLGIFSKIYTHGSIRPTVVPHMGLATSMLVVYDWLERTNHADLEPRDEAPRARAAAAQR